MKYTGLLLGIYKYVEYSHFISILLYVITDINMHNSVY